MPLELRGEISEGLALPIEVLSKYTDIKKLKKGDRFCELNGYRICGPYVPKGMTIDFEKKRLYSTTAARTIAIFLISTFAVITIIDDPS